MDFAGDARAGRPERHSFEYLRHGTLSLYAALEVASGQIHGHCVLRHNSAEFVAFLDQTTREAWPESDPRHRR
jgi:hypothetical protein